MTISALRVTRIRQRDVPKIPVEARIDVSKSEGDGPTIGGPTGLVLGRTLRREVALPKNLREKSEMQWARDPYVLWRAAKHSDNKTNAVVGREFTGAFPGEIKPDQQLAIARKYSQIMADHFGNAVDFSIRESRDGKDIYFRALATARQVSTGGFGNKTALEYRQGTTHDEGANLYFASIVDMQSIWSAAINDAVMSTRVQKLAVYRYQRGQQITGSRGQDGNNTVHNGPTQERPGGDRDR